MKKSVKFMWGNLAPHSSEWRAEVHGEGWGATYVVDWHGFDGEHEGVARLATIEREPDYPLPSEAELALAQEEASSRDSLSEWVRSMEEAYLYDGE